MKKLYIFFSLLLINLLAYGNSFYVMPTRFELKIDKVATNEVYINNNTNRPLRIETYIEGDSDFGKEYNLDSNIAVFPKVVAIKPGGKQVVRFRVKPGQNLKDGEYKSYIVFKEVPGEIKTQGEKKAGDGELTNVSILTELGISIYGSTGNEILKGRIENFKAKYKNKALSVKFDAISEGNTSFKYHYMIEDGKGEVLGKGKCGISPRNGKSPIGFVLTETSKFKGNTIKIKILDQKNNILIEEKVAISK